VATRLDFDAWRYGVDQRINALTGLSADDLPDCPYRDWYDEGIGVTVAARRAIRYAMDEDDWDE